MVAENLHGKMNKMLVQGLLGNGHVVYEKWWEKWEADVECLIDMVDGSVNVEFTNHKPVEE